MTFGQVKHLFNRYRKVFHCKVLLVVYSISCPYCYQHTNRQGEGKTR